MNTTLMRFVLRRYLYKEDIQDILDQLGEAVSGSKPELIDRLLRNPDFEPSAALSYLKMDELQDLCDELDLDSEGSRHAVESRIAEAIEE